MKSRPSKPRFTVEPLGKNSHAIYDWHRRRKVGWRSKYHRAAERADALNRMS